MGIEGVLTSLLGVDKKTLEETIGYTKKIFEMIAGHIIKTEKFYKENEDFRRILQDISLLLLDLNDNVDDVKNLLEDIQEKLEPDWDKIGGTD